MAGSGLLATALEHGKLVHQTLADKVENELKPMGQKLVKAAYPYTEEEWANKLSRKEFNKKAVRKANINQGKLPIVGALFDTFGMPANPEPIEDTFDALYGVASAVSFSRSEDKCKNGRAIYGRVSKPTILKWIKSNI